MPWSFVIKNDVCHHESFTLNYSQKSVPGLNGEVYRSSQSYKICFSVINNLHFFVIYKEEKTQLLSEEESKLAISDIYFSWLQQETYAWNSQFGLGLKPQTVYIP